MLQPSSSMQRSTRVLLALLVIGVWGLLLRPYVPTAVAAQSSAAARSTTFDTLTVQRINVVDPDGKFRLVIANSAKLPGAILHGKAYPRDVNNDTAGVIFYNVQGDETGGLALGEQHGHQTAPLIFDCSYQPTDCIRIWKQEDMDGSGLRESFDIFDRRPYTGRVESTQGIQRISLEDENQNAQLQISDPQGRPRVRIGVDKAGEPSIVMLSPDGKEVYRAGN